MMDAFIHLKQCVCPFCNTETLDLVDTHNRRIRYSEVLNNDAIMNNIINSIPLHHIECTNCGLRFNINWTGEYPQPIVDDFSIIAHFL